MQHVLRALAQLSGRIPRSLWLSTLSTRANATVPHAHAVHATLLAVRSSACLAPVRPLLDRQRYGQVLLGLRSAASEAVLLDAELPAEPFAAEHTAAEQRVHETPAGETPTNSLADGLPEQPLSQLQQSVASSAAEVLPQPSQPAELPPTFVGLWEYFLGALYDRGVFTAANVSMDRHAKSSLQLPPLACGWLGQCFV
jgi:hypothetical protein